MAAMTRDAKAVAAIAAASLLASAAVVPGLVRRIGAFYGEAVTAAAAAAASGPFAYADVKREPAPVPARFSAALPRVQDWREGWTDAHPPQPHVRDLLCAGDDDMWRRAREAILASGEVSLGQVADSYGDAVRWCGGDGCFAVRLVERGDPPPVALPAWMALARCASPAAEARFGGPAVPDVAARLRAEHVKSGELPPPGAAAPAGEAAPTPPPEPLVARLRALGLLPSGVAPARLAGATTAAELLVAAGRGHAFDTETGTYPNEHDSLLRALAALQPDAIPGAVFEEVAPALDDEEQPYLLRAYVGGERFDAEARNLGDGWDVEAAVGLLNAVARARGADVRWVSLATEDQVATVVAGPTPALRAAIGEGLLEAAPPDAVTLESPPRAD